MQKQKKDKKFKEQVEQKVKIEKQKAMEREVLLIEQQMKDLAKNTKVNLKKQKEEEYALLKEQRKGKKGKKDVEEEFNM